VIAITNAAPADFVTVAGRGPPGGVAKRELRRMTPDRRREPPFRPPQLARPALLALARRISDELIEAAAAARKRLAAIEDDEAETARQTP
jgi:hypothetical protein